MRKILLFLLLAASCKNRAVPSTIAITDTSKLLLSEEVTFNDTTETKDTAAIAKYTYDADSSLISMTFEARGRHRHTSGSYKYFYDKDHKLVQENETIDGKLNITEYHYINNVLAYSTNKGSKQHLTDYTVNKNKITRMTYLQDSTVFTNTYQGNTLVKRAMRSKKMTTIDTYKYGTKRSPNFGCKGCYLHGYDSDNELLQDSSVDSPNWMRIEEHNYTYNNHGYPVKDIYLVHSSPEAFMKLSLVTYYKYFPAK